MKQVMVLVAVLGFAVAVYMGCDDSEDPMTGWDGDIENNQLTYCEAIEPILTASCTMCHSSSLSGSDRNGAPTDVNLDTYTGAKGNAQAANARIQAGTMPPAGALSAADKAMFQGWVALQMPEGDCD